MVRDYSHRISLRNLHRDCISTGLSKDHDFILRGPKAGGVPTAFIIFPFKDHSRGV